MTTRYLRAEELARFAGVAKSTVLAAIRRGEIVSSRTVGRGTRISMDSARSYLAERGAEIPDELREVRATSIAVVTEDPMLATRIKSLLNSEWSVTGSPAAYATLLWIGEHSPASVVVDLTMAMLNPFEVIRAVRAMRPSTWVLAVGPSKQLFDAAMAVGASDAVESNQIEALTLALTKRPEASVERESPIEEHAE